MRDETEEQERPGAADPEDRSAEEAEERMKEIEENLSKQPGDDGY